ncbi:MAG TPA: hypothetical protein GX010_00935 [Erysipelotrichaceae bacterium]|nr:hypothetical protein [Erysipelotrichaceae bacterium]
MKQKENKSFRSGNAKIGLPINYRHLFLFAYRTNFLYILKISLILSLFAIPFIIAVVFKGVIESSIAMDQTIEQDIINARIMSFRGLYGFVVSFTFIIFSIGFSGAISSMIRFLTNEGIQFKRDFLLGIKKNGIQIVLITAFYSIILSFLNFIINLPSLLNWYPILLVVYTVVSVIMIGMYFINIEMVCIYQVSFFRSVKNSLLMFISRLPYALLLLITSIAPLVVCYMIDLNIVQYIAWLVYICIGFGHCVLVISLFSLYIFDETVNKKQFPEIYRKGLFNGEDVSFVDEGFKDGSEG